MKEWQRDINKVGVYFFGGAFVAQMPFGVFTAKFIVNLKQKDLGISNIYKMLGTIPNASI